MATAKAGSQMLEHHCILLNVYAFSSSLCGGNAAVCALIFLCVCLSVYTFIHVVGWVSVFICAVYWPNGQIYRRKKVIYWMAMVYSAVVSELLVCLD